MENAQDNDNYYY